jgi:hypothetical protein
METPILAAFGGALPLLQTLMFHGHDDLNARVASLHNILAMLCLASNLKILCYGGCRDRHWYINDLYNSVGWDDGKQLVLSELTRLMFGPFTDYPVIYAELATS